MSALSVSGFSLSFLQGLTVSNKIATPLVSMAIGRVMAFACPLPPTEVEGYKTYYHEAMPSEVMAFLDQIYNVVPIKHRDCEDYAKKFWLSRYAAAYGSPIPTTTGKNGVYNMFHVGLFFSGEELGLINNHSEEFGGLVASFGNILAGIISAS